ncbi:MAG: hypothetical protein KAV87_67120, partial [Desulfobacteraceae bacterium]|nr:hypothetical protein [Desulfobacteraceae bacterium]
MNKNKTFLVMAILIFGLGQLYGICAAQQVDCESIWWRPGHGETWYEDNPTYFDSRDDTASWDFSTPEA